MARPADETHRRAKLPHWHYGPVVGIAVLLACWFVIAEWDVLPEVISHTMAAVLP
jgi:hypothetical protein